MLNGLLNGCSFSNGSAFSESSSSAQFHGGRIRHNCSCTRLCGQTLCIEYRIACLCFMRRVLNLITSSKRSQQILEPRSSPHVTSFATNRDVLCALEAPQETCSKLILVTSALLVPGT